MNARSDVEVNYLNTPDFQEEEIELGDYLAVLIQSKWLILAVTLIALLVGGGYAMIAQPIYSADGLLQVEEKKSTLGSLDISTLLEGETAVNAEIELLRSRLVLGKTVDNLRLDFSARPVYFPLIGQAIARRYHAREGVAEPWFGLDHYAWGGEVVEVSTFDIPLAYLGKTFTIVAGKEGLYQLLEPEGEILLEGQVGHAVQTEMGRDGTLTLFISTLTARPGTRFELVRNARFSAIETLQDNLKVTEKGKQSGMIAISLEGSDPRRVTATINEIANIYVRQNVERKSAEAEQTLSFLEDQLPVLKQRLETAEVALNSYRLQRGSVDLPKETQVVLEKIVAVDGQLIQLKQKRDELLQKFTPAHPIIMALDAQTARLNQELADLNQHVKNLPDTQQEVLRLSRDVQVNTELYTSLLNSAQELRVVKAGTVGNVRIVDYAVTPYLPIKPKKGLILTLSLVLGLFLGTVAAFVRKALRGGVEDPDLMEKQLGLPVYATIPHSKQQDKLIKRVRAKRGPHAVLAMTNAEDLSIESLRSLRTTLHFALMEAKNNIIMITGPSPGVGKSFISVNLCAVLASTGKRVVLIDADLRKGHLNQYLGLDRDQGLTGLISGTLDKAQVIHPTPIAGLDLIPTGAIPPNPSELLLHERFAACLEELVKGYDHVIIDSPPVLAVTDAAIVGRLAGASLMVVKAGVHPLREIEHSVKRLKQAGVNLRGLLFNDVKVLSRRYGYGYGKYAYQYAYKKS